MQEVAPGIFRIESVLGPRPFSQWLLRDELALLVDTGVKDTPRDVILPALDGIELDFVVVSHADVDHHGGDAAIRAACPGALLVAGAGDVPLIESSERILRERYGWYDEHGIGYPPETFAWLRDNLGDDVPVDLALTGGEQIRLGPRLTVRVIGLPGHSSGHLGLWEPRSRTAVVQDAVMGSGLLDTDGNVVHPPPIPDVPAYERSARLLQELHPDLLLTAHYHPIEGDAVATFLDESLAFVARARALVQRHRHLPLAELLGVADAELGPFTSMPNELAATLRSLAGESTATRKETAWSSA
jgi:glyoxylase-like metal-dependent hydrolase (beta-lactamase superfamily II)